MELSDLENIGLSKTEATLYTALIKLGSSDVQTLVKETKLYKANIYQALERLCDKGIISKITELNKRIYQLQPPKSLIEFVEKKKENIAKQEELAKKISLEVKFAKKHTHSSETAAVFRGIQGVKQIYSEIIEKKIDYLDFGTPIESEEIGEYYWENLHLKQKENGIKARMIFHKSLKKWKEKIPEDVAKLKFFDEEFEPLTETTIYGTKVAFTVWTKIPVITIIDNEHVANSYKQIFEMLWKKAKK